MPYPRLYNAAYDMVDRHIAEGRAGKTVFVDPSRSITYGELTEETNRMANVLTAFGLQREARVALLLHDTIDFPIAFWGAIKAGIVPVALNTLLPTEQYAYILGDSRAKALIVSAALLPAVQPILTELPFLTHLVVSGGPAPSYGFTFSEELTRQPATFEPAATCADEIAFWLYSSGSTGMPKGVRHVHTNLAATAETYARQVLGIREDDVGLSAAKLFFAYGLGNALTFPMSVGATTVLNSERPTPALMFSLMNKYNPSIFFGVPTLFSAMLNDETLKGAGGGNRLRICTPAGEP